MWVQHVKPGPLHRTSVADVSQSLEGRCAHVTVNGNNLSGLFCSFFKIAYLSVCVITQQIVRTMHFINKTKCQNMKMTAVRKKICRLKRNKHISSCTCVWRRKCIGGMWRKVFLCRHIVNKGTVFYCKMLNGYFLKGLLKCIPRQQH